MLLTGILIFELAVAIAAYVTPNMDEYISKALWESMTHYDASGDDAKAVDLLHETFNCCGVDSYRDWKNTTKHTWPQSCCYSYIMEGENPICGERDIPSRTDGCLGKLKFAAYQSRYLIASMALSVAFVQVNISI